MKGGHAIVPDDMWTKRIFNVISAGTQSQCQPWAQHSLVSGGNHVTVTAISNNYSISVADGKYFMIDTKWGETGDCLESAPGWSWSERIPALSQEPGLIHCSWLSSSYQPLQPCTIV